MEEIKREIQDMENVAKKTFDRVKAKLLSNETLEIADVSMLIDIAKDAGELMKATVKIKQHYMQHPEMKI